jgi:hypothetical protein
MRRVSPPEGVICPFRIAATPDIIGNLKSNILGSTFVMSNCWRARAVATPSVVSLVAIICSKDSPLARRTPTCLFLERGPMHVPKVSPTPAKPPKVSLSAPNNSPTLEFKKERLKGNVQIHNLKEFYQENHNQNSFQSIHYLPISWQPLVTREDIAFIPRPNPSHIPAANAITFFTAPPNSSP